MRNPLIPSTEYLAKAKALGSPNYPHQFQRDDHARILGALMQQRDEAAAHRARLRTEGCNMGFEREACGLIHLNEDRRAA